MDATPAATMPAPAITATAPAGGAAPGNADATPGGAAPGNADATPAGTAPGNYDTTPTGAAPANTNYAAPSSFVTAPSAWGNTTGIMQYTPGANSASTPALNFGAAVLAVAAIAGAAFLL